MLAQQQIEREAAAHMKARPKQMTQETHIGAAYLFERVGPFSFSLELPKVVDVPL